MRLSLVTAPSGEPIALDEAKRHLAIESDSSAKDEDLDARLIPAARERAEGATDRAFLTQTWDLLLDAFPGDAYVEIPKPPLQSVTYVKYRDTQGTLQTWAASNYVVQAPSGPRASRGRLALAYGVVWPSTYGEIGDVTIRFICGYGTAADVPGILRAAMLLDIGTLDLYRENVARSSSLVALPNGVEAIYRSFRSHATQRLRGC